MRTRWPEPLSDGLAGRGGRRRRGRDVAPAVAHPAGLADGDHHLREVVLVALVRLGELEVVAAEHDREDRLQLHHREGGAHAAVASGAEGDPAEALAVLLASGEVALGQVALRVGEVLGHAVRHRRRRRHQVTRGHGIALVVEVAHHLAHQDDERRVEAQRLLQRALEQRDLAQRLVADVAPVGEQLVELGGHLAVPLRVLEQVDHRPGGRHRRGVVPGEHHRDEHAGDLVVAEAALPFLVAEAVEHLEEVGALGAAAFAFGEDALDAGDQRAPGAVARAQGRDRQVGVHVGEGVGAALQVHEERSDVGAQLFAELGADQARGARVERQLGEEIEQVDLAALPPAGGHALHLGGDLLRVASHEAVAQRLVAHGLLALLRAGVEHDALAEDGLHEGVGGGLVELLVGRAEEGLLGFLTGQQRDAMTDEPELADLSALATQPGHQGERVAPELEQVAEEGPASAQARRPDPPSAAARWRRRPRAWFRRRSWVPPPRTGRAYERYHLQSM